MIAALMTAFGALVYRWRGSPFSIRPFSQIVFALPFGAFVALHYVSLAGLVYGALIWAVTAALVCKGHGRAFRLYEPMKAGSYPEDFEIPIRWLEGRIPLYWYKVLIHVVSGLAYTLPAGIATLNPVVAMSGALKAPAYMISEKLFKNTEGGEYLTGALLWGSLVLQF